MANHAEARPMPVSPPLRALRLLWGAAATVLCVLYTAVLATAAAIASPINHGHLVTGLARFWGRIILATCGIRVEMEGFERLKGIGPHIVVCNHQSFIDIFAIAAYWPGEPRFV